MEKEQLLIALLVGVALGVLSGGFQKVPASNPDQMESQSPTVHKIIV